jgi:hypothetical protein
LSSCATLTYRTTRGQLTIPRRHRTRNWAARASPSRSHSVLPRGRRRATGLATRQASDSCTAPRSGRGTECDRLLSLAELVGRGYSRDAIG